MSQEDLENLEEQEELENLENPENPEKETLLKDANNKKFIYKNYI